MPPNSRKPLRGTVSVKEICTNLKISRRTFYEWRAKGKAPECWPLPNGELRVYVDDYERWLSELGAAA
jgi:predicted site-specific integrase-resolvase